MNLLRKISIVVLTAGLWPAVVSAAELTAEQAAQNGISLLLSTVAEAKPYFATDRDRYFVAVEGALSTFVDFEEVAVVVMSRFGDSATDEQKKRFAGILKNTLTRFYGVALLTYAGEELIYLPSNTPPTDPENSTNVRMQIKGADSSFELQYQMFLNDEGQWKLKNLSLGGINLARQYNTQFTALMTQHENDIGLVLDNWR